MKNKDLPFDAFGCRSSYSEFVSRRFAFRTDAFWYAHQFAVLYAHSRMVKEMDSWGMHPGLGWWEPQAAVEWCSVWEERYDAHLAAINRSYCYWLKHRCPDCFHQRPELAAASRYGFMERMDAVGLPSKCAQQVLARVKKAELSGSRESEFFHKHANPNASNNFRWDYQDLDLWLIEVWPLVDEYIWTYRDVYDLAFERFKDNDGYCDAAALDRVEFLKERCHSINLHLSQEAQQLRGRPKRSDAKPLDDFGERVFHRSSRFYSGAAEWIISRAPRALQALSEMAVTLDPFTKLLEGVEKEPFPIAVPNFKNGGKSFRRCPPFVPLPMPQNERHDNKSR